MYHMATWSLWDPKPSVGRWTQVEGFSWPCMATRKPTSSESFAACRKPFQDPKGPRTQRIVSLKGVMGHGGVYSDIWGLYKGPRTQIVAFSVPNTIKVIVFGPYSPIVGVLGPLGRFA